MLKDYLGVDVQSELCVLVKLHNSPLHFRFFPVLHATVPSKYPPLSYIE